MQQFEVRMRHNFDDIFAPRLTLIGLGARDLFFQSIYAHPLITPSLLSLNKIACEIFEQKGNGCGYDAPYMPPLSLVYGDNINVVEKAGTMADLAVKVVGIKRKPFKFGSLQLWKTEGTHDNWECIRKVDLPLPFEYSKKEIETMIEPAIVEASRASDGEMCMPIVSHTKEGDVCMDAEGFGGFDEMSGGGFNEMPSGRGFSEKKKKKKSVGFDDRLGGEIDENALAKAGIFSPSGISSKRKNSSVIFKNKVNYRQFDSESGAGNNSMTKNDVMKWAMARKALIAAHDHSAHDGPPGQKNRQKSGSFGGGAYNSNSNNDFTNFGTKSWAGSRPGSTRNSSVEDLPPFPPDAPQSDSPAVASDRGSGSSNSQSSADPCTTRMHNHSKLLRDLNDVALSRKRNRLKSRRDEIYKVMIEKIAECEEKEKGGAVIPKGHLDSIDEDADDYFGKQHEGIYSPEQSLFGKMTIEEQQENMSDGYHKHPVLDIIADYNFSEAGGKALAGIGWGVLGSASRHGEFASHGDIFNNNKKELMRRSSTGMV